MGAARLLRRQIETDIPTEGVKREGYFISRLGIDPLSLLHATIKDDLLPCGREVPKLLDNLPKSVDEEYRTGHEFYGVYMLLTGLAIENILKCICVVRHPELVVNGIDERLRTPTHNIYNLAVDKNKLHLALNDEEERILKKLTDFISRGRYAVPLKPSAHRAFF